jgi:hypothetical protein
MAGGDCLLLSILEYMLESAGDMICIYLHNNVIIASVALKLCYIAQIIFAV